MFLAVLILVAAGVYVFLRKEIRASSKFVIRGRPAVHVGLALMLGGLLVVVLPTVLNAVGLLKDIVGGFEVSMVTLVAVLVYIAVVMWIEKRRQVKAGRAPVSSDKAGAKPRIP